jgi:hypothetical protein
MVRPPRIPVWLSWEQPVIYFVTICVAKHQSVLANKPAFNAFKAAVATLHDWRVLAAHANAGSLACNRRTFTPSRSEIGKFFRGIETLDAPGTNASWN